MSTSGGPRRVARGLTEFVVIVLGVMIALAADRWIAGIDERADRDFYLERLVDNLRADSVTLESRIAEADSTAEVALTLLLYIDGGPMPGADDPVSFMQRFEMVSFFSPVEWTRETWDDLIAPGNASLLEPELRRTLSLYYNHTEQQELFDRDWDQQLLMYESQSWSIRDPLDRLAALQSNGGGQIQLLPDSVAGERRSSRASIQALRPIFLADPVLHGHLGQVNAIRRISAYRYAQALEVNSATLRELEVAGGA